MAGFRASGLPTAVLDGKRYSQDVAGRTIETHDTRTT